MSGLDNEAANAFLKSLMFTCSICNKSHKTLRRQRVCEKSHNSYDGDLK